MDTSAPVHPYGQDLRMLEFVPKAMLLPESTLLPTALPDALPAAARASLPSSDAPSTSASDFGPFSLAPPHAAVPPAGFTPAPPRSALSPLNLPTAPPASASSTCHLLLLPPELLDQILALALPYTTHTSKGIAWVRRSTALLATCAALHEAGARHVYGSNTFVLRTSFTGTKWHCAWIRPRSAFLRSSSHAQVLQRFIDTARVTAGERPYGGPPVVRGTLNTVGRSGGGGAHDPAPLVPSRLLPFPAALPARYRPLLRRIALTVHVEDAYTGEIKYGMYMHAWFSRVPSPDACPMS